jgi:hypothetical protein
MNTRHAYQREIEHLLAQIDSGMHDVRLLKVAGVRGGALADRKREVRAARERLASVVGAGPALSDALAA